MVNLVNILRVIKQTIDFEKNLWCILVRTLVMGAACSEQGGWSLFLATEVSFNESKVINFFTILTIHVPPSSVQVWGLFKQTILANSCWAFSWDEIFYDFLCTRVGYVPLPTTKIDFSSDLERPDPNQKKKKKVLMCSPESGIENYYGGLQHSVWFWCLNFTDILCKLMVITELLAWLLADG